MCQEQRVHQDLATKSDAIGFNDGSENSKLLWNNFDINHVNRPELNYGN